MKMKIKLFFAFFLGLLSIIIISYYYLHQRSFAQRYKTVITGFHSLQVNYDTLSYDLLKSALYGYSNQDDIARGIQRLHVGYANLYNAPLLHEQQYLSLDYPLIDLGVAITKYDDTIEQYLMLNAGIKNSYLFLINLSETTHDLFSADDTIHQDLSVIVATLSNIRRLLDDSHTADINKHLYNITHYPTQNAQQKAFVETATLHIQFILDNFSEFSKLIGQLQSKDIEFRLTHINEQFNQIAENDFLLIDTLATLMLILVISAILSIIILLLNAQRENRRLKTLQKELERSANYDTLTGLLNRNKFNRTIIDKEYKKPLFLLININSFKHINDIYGSEVGDYILQEISLLIKLSVFKDYSPSYYRLGGDDFGVLLESISKKKALAYAETLSLSIKHFTFLDNDIEINISVSIAINDEPPYLENADMVLKHAKKHHSETIVSFSSDLKLREEIQSNIDTIQALYLAIDEGRIIPYFQPIIEFATGKIVKYEALIRQQSKTGKIIPPDQFLPLAAQTPLYRELTKIMIEKVFKTFEDAPYRFSINLSMRDLLDSELMQMLEEQLISNPEKAKRLEIELLESENLFDIQATERFITLLKSYGCRIAIDDFGTGYSNFSYLARLSIDTLKIDGSLITKILSDEKYLKTVKTIVHYAETLGVETVAEFVETKEIALKLREIGVTYGQGYYFDKPQPTLVKKEILL